MRLALTEGLLFGLNPRGFLRCSPTRPLTRANRRPPRLGVTPLASRRGRTNRYYRTMKNVLLVDNDYLQWILERRIVVFVEYYNHRRVQESLGNLT